MSSPRILIEGIGGIGGILSAEMIRVGYAPVLVTHNDSITQAINSRGICLKTSQGDTTIRTQAYTFLSEVSADALFDAAYLIMKANHVASAVKQTLPLLKPEGYFVTFQNGIVEDEIAKIVGTDRVVSSIIGWGGTMHTPGVYEKTSPGKTYIGELNGTLTPRLQQLSATLSSAAPVVMTQNIRGVMWSKLAINCCITTIGALTGDTLGVMLQNSHIRQLFLRCYGEVIETAEALRIQLEPVTVPPKLLYLPQETQGLVAWSKDWLVKLVAHKYSQLKSSSLQSLERGRKTEIDYLNGYVVQCAKQVGVEVPVNAVLVKMVQEIEAGKRTISRKNAIELIQPLQVFIE